MMLSYVMWFPIIWAGAAGYRLPCRLFINCFINPFINCFINYFKLSKT